MANWTAFLTRSVGKLAGSLADRSGTAEQSDNLRREGNRHLAQGEYEEAAQCYRKALESNPGNVAAMVNQGFVLIELGRYDEADEYLKSAIAIESDQCDANYLLGKLALNRSAPQEAIRFFQQAIRAKPDFAEAYASFASACAQTGQADLAITTLMDSLTRIPGSAVLHRMHGDLLKEQSRYSEAVGSYLAALAIDPEDVNSHNNLATVYKELGQLGNAITHFSKAGELAPELAVIENNLGTAYQESGDIALAIEHYLRAIDLDAGMAAAHNNVANLYRQKHEFDAALIHYQKAIELEPGCAECNANMGRLYALQKDFVHAIDSFRQAVRSDPGRNSFKLALAHAYQHACKWDELQPLSQALRASIALDEQQGDDPISPFSFIALPGTSPAEQLACAKQYALNTYRSYAERRLPAPTLAKKRKGDRLRIGYCTADFKQHPVAFLMAEVFELHDRDRFEIHAYSYGVDDQSPIRKRIENAFDEFNDIHHYSIEDAAHAIRADGIDILVDLTGYTEDGRTEILALKPAPIQVSYLGFLGTSGTDFMDYILADDFLVPAGQEVYYSERVKRLTSYQANDRKCAIAARPSRADLGLPEHGFVFCDFNQTYKILPDVFNIWLRLLRNTPDSVLWLYANNTQAILHLRNAAAGAGIAHDRLIFAPMLPLDQHLARLQCADLFLDTLPYNAGTTASNALWAGLPVVTCAGETFSSRMAGSLLTAVGLPELITYDLESYYLLALELANSPDKLGKIKNKLNQVKDGSLLFDSTVFTRNLENAFLEMYEDQCLCPAKPNTATM